MTFFIVTDTMGLETISSHLTRAIADMPELVQKALGELGVEMTKAFADATPAGTGRTGGHLDASYRSEVAEDAVILSTTQGKKLTWVRYGTGVYGQFSSPIVPVHAEAMWWPEAAHPYRSVRGQPPNDFITPILNDAQTYLNEVLTPFTDQLATILEGG